METIISKDTLEKWLKGWTLSRKLSPPVKYKSGYKVDVGFESQKARYVFLKLNEDFISLANEIQDNYIFLKVCASPEEIIPVIPTHWKIQPQGYMMSCSSPMNISEVSLPDAYTIEIENYNSTFFLKIFDDGGVIAATGRIVLVDDLAIYDRIITEENYRRKGLATILVSRLERIAISNGVYNNFLVATEEGRLLYHSLGWKTCSLYTSVVIER